MDPATLTITVAVIAATISLAGVCVSIWASGRQAHKDDLDDKAETAMSNARLSAQLDSLMTMMLDVKRTVMETDRKMDNHTERIVILEGKVSTLFMRRDEDALAVSELAKKVERQEKTCLEKRG